jgi:hypothetical protein
MDEEAIRKLVLETMEEEVTREGGTADHCRSAALSFVQAIIDLKFRDFREELMLKTSPLEARGGGMPNLARRPPEDRRPTVQS